MTGESLSNEQDTYRNDTIAVRLPISVGSFPLNEFEWNILRKNRTRVSESGDA